MNRTVLLVDDDEAVAEVARILLSMRGCTVHVATGGEEALALFRPGVFDVVLVDYSMPGMRGDRLIATLRDRAPGQRLVLMSGFVDVNLPENTRFLHKPFGLEELENAVAAPAQDTCSVG